MLIDSHCHLDFPDFAERLDEVVDNAIAAGVDGMITISTLVAREPVYRALAEHYRPVLFTVGTHPHNAAAEPDTDVSALVALSRHPRCVAIGEAGLDYHYDKSPRDVQRRVFRAHIEAARASGLPLVIHAREADDDMVSILDEEMGRGRFEAVLHCFSSGSALAVRGAELGLYLSFSGILTFRRSDALRDIARCVPRDRILVETDAPYLAPVPYRGKTNEPAYVRHTAEVLAETLKLSFSETAAMTRANTLRLFGKASSACPAFAHRTP